MDFHWVQQDGEWLLKPSMISVRSNDSFFFVIHVGDRPLNARYTSEQGAKLDAWEFAKSKAQALFGVRDIRLVSETTKKPPAP